MKTTQTTSPKVMKQTSTAIKQKAIMKKEVKLPKNWGKILVDGKHVDFNTMQDIEVPTLRKIQEPKMSLINKVSLVLAVVNVVILISLVIKNV